MLVQLFGKVANDSLCACLCVCGSVCGWMTAFYNHKFHADLLSSMLYIVKITHTHMPLLCKGFLSGPHITEETNAVGV